MPDKGAIVELTEWLFRRYYLKEPKKLLSADGGVNSRVFKPRKPHDNGMLSVNAKSLTTFMHSVKNDPDTWALFEILNSHVKSITVPNRQKLETIHDPEEDNISHCLIVKIDEDDDITPALLAKHARRVFQVQTGS